MGRPDQPTVLDYIRHYESLSAAMLQFVEDQPSEAATVPPVILGDPQAAPDNKFFDSFSKEPKEDQRSACQHYARRRRDITE